MAKKFYAYTVPSTGEKGVTESWAECEKKVSGVAGARFKAFVNVTDAKEWLEKGALYKPGVRKIKTKKPLDKGIYFDAGTGRGQGHVESNVTNEAGSALLSNVLKASQISPFGTYIISDKEVTNNYGELLAMRFALEIGLKNNIKKIFGDSKLVIAYWSKGKVTKKNMKPETYELIQKVRELREEFEKGGGVVAHIAGDRNPADLGFHR